MVAVLEAEAHDYMGHLRPSPISEKEIERLQLREVVSALAPRLGEVGVGPPIEIANIGERQNVALDRSGRLPRAFGRPVAVERRLDRAPPGEQASKGDGKDSECDQAAAAAHE